MNGLRIRLTPFQGGSVVRLAVHEHPDRHAYSLTRRTRFRHGIDRTQVPGDVEARPRRDRHLNRVRPFQELQQLLLFALRYVVDFLHVRQEVLV